MGTADMLQSYCEIYPKFKADIIMLVFHNEFTCNAGPYAYFTYDAGPYAYFNYDAYTYFESALTFQLSIFYQLVKHFTFLLLKCVDYKCCTR